MFVIIFNEGEAKCTSFPGTVQGCGNLVLSSDRLCPFPDLSGEREGAYISYRGPVHSPLLARSGLREGREGCTLIR